MEQKYGINNSIYDLELQMIQKGENQAALKVILRLLNEKGFQDL